MSVLYMEKSSISSLTEADIKKLIDENSLGTKYSDLKNYYIGNHKSPYADKRKHQALNNRIINNMAKYVTDTAVGYFVGKPVVYSSQNEEFAEKLQNIFDYND